VARCTLRAPVGPRGGVGQGDRGWRSPEWRCGVEAVEKHRDSGVHWWGEGSGGRWRWRRGPAVLVWKREGEGGLNWGRKSSEGGTHQKEADVGDARTKFGMEEGSSVVGANEVDAWAVEKRAWCSGLDGRGMVKRGTGDSQQLFKPKRGEGGGGNGGSARCRMGAGEEGRGGPTQRSAARGRWQRPPCYTPVLKEQNRSLYTCAQDVQITRIVKI
jgi:hypothetical protein